MLVPVTVTVNVAVCPSSTLVAGPVTLTVNSSSSVIVPTASASPRLTPAGSVTPLSATLNVSSASFRSSSAVATVTVFTVSPAMNVSVVADTAV